MYVTYALTGAVSWDSVPTTATASSSTPEKDTKRVKRIRLKQSTSAFPTLPTLYEGPLLCENMLARIYLYSYLVHLDHADALAWPTHHVDALHCWDDTLAFSILQRLLVPLAHLTSIEQGQPTSRTQEAVHAVRQFHAASHTPWAAARHLAEHYPVPFHALPHVASTLPSLASKPKARAVVEDVAPRRTRSAARLEARVAQLEERLREPVALSDDEDDEDEAPYTSRRRSQRAATLAVKKAHADLRARAAQLRAPQAPVLHDDAPPMPLEEKWACLVTLCDALAISTAKMPPFENPLHKLVQPIVDAAHSTHERKQRVQEVEQQCADELRALQKTAPSMVSPQYAAWKQQKQEMIATHERQKRWVRAEMYLQARREALRDGPLGCDAQGREYWHLLPVSDPSKVCAEAAQGVATPSMTGHWSHKLLVHMRGADVWYATTSTDDVDAMLAYLRSRTYRALLAKDATSPRLEPLLASLEGVRDYLAWAYH